MNVEFSNLPDTNKIPAGYHAYGRFGITNSGNIFVLRENSSHPQNTDFGGYYAINYRTRTITLSPRGVALGFEDRIKAAPTILNVIKKTVGL